MDGPWRNPEGSYKGVGPTYLHKRGHSELFLLIGNRLHGESFLGAWAGGGSAGPVLRSQGGSGEEVAFALRARGLGDRLQCSLRPGPADNFGVRNRIVTQRSIRS